MSPTSFDRLLRSSRLAFQAPRNDAFRVSNSVNMLRSDRERLDGTVREGRGRSSAGGSELSGLAQKMHARTPMRRFGPSADVGGRGGAGCFDARQRAIVKVHYFNHAGGGGAALKAHARYVARDAAGRDGPQDLTLNEARPDSREAQDRARAHASYLSRDTQAERSVFYDAEAEGVDGAGRAEAWARSDKRHFRLILSAENGARIGDLPAYTREVMARAEAALGTKLQWVAVDHWDTDNPHTHLIVRGRRTNGQDLVIPKDFIRYGVHSIARDVATEWLGGRSAADERMALDREVIRHGPTRLDRMIAAQLPEDRTVRIASLEAADDDPDRTQAIKARARELQRMGLAQETGRNVVTFSADWQERLKAMEMHLDIRRRIVRERLSLQRTHREASLDRALRGLFGR